MTESIHYILKDDVSEGLLSIRDKTVLLDKATQTLKDDYRKLEKELGELTKAQRAWEKALESSGKKSSKATQEYEKFLEAAGGEDANAAVELQRELQQELEQTRELLRKTRKEAENLNKAGGEGISLTGKASGEQSIGGKWQFLEKLGRAGVLNPLASAAGSFANEKLSSALGEQAGTMASNVLGGVASGIAMGTATGNPWGILAGGVVGLISGTLNGFTKKNEAKDDALKEYYAGLYDTVRANTTEGLSRGKTLAASKETEEAAALKEMGAQYAALSEVYDRGDSTEEEKAEAGLSRTYAEFMLFPGWVVDSHMLHTRASLPGSRPAISTAMAASLFQMLPKRRKPWKRRLSPHYSPAAQRISTIKTSCGTLCAAA